MINKAERIVELIKKKLANSLTKSEKQELDQWVALTKENRLHLDEISGDTSVDEYMKDFYLPSEEEGWRNVERRIFKSRTKKVRMFAKLPLRITAAAALFVILSTSVYLFLIKSDKKGVTKSDQPKATKNDVPPGGDRAVLTLSDGSKIILDTAENGELTNEGNTKIIKLDGGQLVYNSGSGQISPNSNFYNTITTPRAGQYKLILPDGTKVWLNAASSIRFPVVFAGKNRTVELSGEAYFEVQSLSSFSKKIPFTVKVREMEIQVLGTHFNVMAYTDEPSIKTTLLEGAVKITKGPSAVSLKPGQQAQLDNQNNFLNVKEVDTLEAVAWKNNNINFKDEEFEAVMRKIERWYDVEVSYEGYVKETDHLSGQISRRLNLSEVLEIMELVYTDIYSKTVHFKLEGKKVIVIPLNNNKNH